MTRRAADHPGILFKDGPTGRRAALAYGPDVWEIIKFLREIDAADDASERAERAWRVRQRLIDRGMGIRLPCGGGT